MPSQYPQDPFKSSSDFSFSKNYGISRNELVYKILYFDSINRYFKSRRMLSSYYLLTNVVALPVLP